MTTDKVLLTADDLLNMPDDGRCYELLDGELVEMSPPGGEHGAVSFEVGFTIGAHVKAHNLGKVLTNDPGIILSRHPDRVRGPDICFIARERIPSEGIPKGYLEIIPDLVVEVISPSDSAVSVQEKIEEWLQAGVRLVLAVYPNTRSVVAYRSLSEVRVYTEADTLEGAPVLPDFRCPVAELFP